MRPIANLFPLDIPPPTPPKDHMFTANKYNSSTPLRRRPSFFRSLFRPASNPPPPLLPPKDQDENGKGRHPLRTRPNLSKFRLWPCTAPYNLDEPRQSPATLSSAPFRSKVHDEKTITYPTGAAKREVSPKTVEGEWRAGSRSLAEGFRECLNGAMCVAITDPTEDFTNDVLRSTVKKDSNEKLYPLRRSRPRSSPPPLFDNIYTPLPDPVRPPPHRPLPRSNSLRDVPRPYDPPHVGHDGREQFANRDQRYPDPPQQRRESSYQRRRAAQAPSLETIHSQSLTRNSQNSEDITRWVQSTSVASRASVSVPSDTNARVSQEVGPERKVANAIERSITLDSVSVTLGCYDEGSQVRQLIRPWIARRKAIHRVESKSPAVSSSSIRQDARRLVDNLRESERTNSASTHLPANAVWGQPRIPRLTSEQLMQVASDSAIGSSASLPTTLGRSTGTNSGGSCEEDYRIRRGKKFEPNKYPRSLNTVTPPGSRIDPDGNGHDHAIRAHQSAPMLGYHTPEDEIRRRKHIQQFADSPTPRTAWVVVPTPPEGGSPTPTTSQIRWDDREVVEDGRRRRRRKLEGVV